MNILKWLFPRHKTVIISAEHATIFVAVVDRPKPARSILFTIPVHHSLIINHKHVNMTTTFKPTGKVPFVLQWLDANRSPTNDAVTNVQGTVGDSTSADAVFDEGSPKTGWIKGKANGSGALVFTGLNSLGQPIQSVPVTLTVDDGSGTPPPPPNVAASIGVTLGDEVAQ